MINADKHKREKVKGDHELVKLIFTPGDHLIYGLIVRHLVLFLTEKQTQAIRRALDEQNREKTTFT